MKVTPLPCIPPRGWEQSSRGFGETFHITIILQLSNASRADGHLRMIIEMIEEGPAMSSTCTELQAIESAIENAKKALIHDHVGHCLDVFEGAPAQEGAQRCGRSS